MESGVRPHWPTYFTNIAREVSTRASCPRASVGAVLVKDNRLLATGYNGAPTGQSHCLDDGCIMEDGHCQRSLHAEVNAIAHAARAGVSIQGAHLYLYDTLERGPCRECQKVLRAAGVTW